MKYNIETTDVNGQSFIRTQDLLTFLDRQKQHAYWLDGEHMLTKVIQKIQQTKSADSNSSVDPGHV